MTVAIRGGDTVDIGVFSGNEAWPELGDPVIRSRASAHIHVSIRNRNVRPLRFRQSLDNDPGKS